MKIIYFIIVLLISLGSCNKFKYEEIPITNCELCPYADSIEGNYRGKAYGIFFMNANGNPESDSATINLEHIFQNKGSFVDSNNMYFKMTYKFDNKPTIYTRVLEIKDRSGVPSYSPYKYIPNLAGSVDKTFGSFIISDNTISISHGYHTPTTFPNYFSITAFKQ